MCHLVSRLVSLLTGITHIFLRSVFSLEWVFYKCVRYCKYPHVTDDRLEPLETSSMNTTTSVYEQNTTGSF